MKEGEGFRPQRALGTRAHGGVVGNDISPLSFSIALSIYVLISLFRFRFSLSLSLYVLPGLLLCLSLILSLLLTMCV